MTIRSEQIQVRVTPEEKQQIEQAASADSRTVSQWVLLAVRKAIQADGAVGLAIGVSPSTADSKLGPRDQPIFGWENKQMSSALADDLLELSLVDELTETQSQTCTDAIDHIKRLELCLSKYVSTERNNPKSSPGARYKARPAGNFSGIKDRK